MDRKIKHLEFIQSVIIRLVPDEGVVRGPGRRPVHPAGAGRPRRIRRHRPHPRDRLLGPDVYFLWQERQYRALYDHVRALEEDEIDFSMNVSLFRKSRGCIWPSDTFSRTLLPFYGALALAVALAMIAS